jgi:nicotinic acetylcholine receptor
MLFTLFKLVSLIRLVCSSELELKNILFEKYKPDIIPDNTVQIKLGLAIRSLNNINQIDGTISSNVWLRHWWNDKNLKWNETKWNISKISAHTNHELDRSIWTPDILIYNTAEKPMDELLKTNVMVYSNGDIIWSRPGMLRTSCVFDLENFPFDTQTCSYKFGSWLYDKSQIDISNVDNPIDLTNYQSNQEWSIINSEHYIEEKVYKCCTETFQSTFYKITIKRKYGYYVLNIILPTFATSTLMIICLLIPWDSGERISYAVTVMLSIIVFLLILSENLPKTETKPLLSKMLIGLVFFALFIVYSTVFIGIMHDYTKKNSKVAKSIISILDKYNLSCKRKNSEPDSDSIDSTISEEEIHKKDCDNLAIIVERLFTSVFFVIFAIYCIVMFSLRP